MTWTRFLKASVTLIFLSASQAPTALAEWSLNLGYNNPPGATVGLNAMRTFSRGFAIEFGVGWFNINNRNSENSESKDKDTTQFALSGDINLKYFFSSGTVKPYLQGGFGMGLAGDIGGKTGLGAGVGSGFGGIGVNIGSKSIYAYASGNLISTGDPFLQAGVGFGI